MRWSQCHRYLPSGVRRTFFAGPSRFEGRRRCGRYLEMASSTSSGESKPSGSCVMNVRILSTPATRSTAVASPPAGGETSTTGMWRKSDAAGSLIAVRIVGGDGARALTQARRTPIVALHIHCDKVRCPPPSPASLDTRRSRMCSSPGSKGARRPRPAPSPPNTHYVPSLA